MYLYVDCSNWLLGFVKYLGYLSELCYNHCCCNYDHTVNKTPPVSFTLSVSITTTRFIYPKEMKGRLVSAQLYHTRKQKNPVLSLLYLNL